VELAHSLTVSARRSSFVRDRRRGRRDWLLSRVKAALCRPATGGHNRADSVFVREVPVTTIARQREVTGLLVAASDGDRRAAEELLPLVYGELRRLARSRMRREGPQTLQPTALVHEAYLRLIGDQDPGWENRGHFFGAAARAMRRILIERARRYARLKHGAEYRFVELDAELAVSNAPRPEELLSLDRALERLESIDEAMAQVAQLRFFAGLTEAETASTLDRSERTVRRLWSSARTWLRREMTRESAPAGRANRRAESE